MHCESRQRREGLEAEEGPVGIGRGQDEGAGEGRDRRSHFAAYHRHRKGGRFARDRFETPAIRAIEVGSDQMSRKLHGPLEAA